MFTLILSLAMVGDTPATKIEASSADDNTRVCRSISTLGTKIPKRTCRTKMEWAELDKANSENSEEAMRRDQSYSRGTQNSN